MYTGQITFAALSSQDVTPSEKEDQDDCSQGERESPQDSEGLSAPSLSAVVVEPCSPKSVYCLADKVRLASFEKIQSPIALEFRSGRLDRALRFFLGGYSVQAR